MKAARWYKAKDIRVEETNIPSPNENQVKVEVKFTGICGSDLHEYTKRTTTYSCRRALPSKRTSRNHDFRSRVFWSSRRGWEKCEEH